MRLFDSPRLYAPHMCLLLFYAYNIAGIAIPFSFVTITVHRFCIIYYYTKPFFKTKQWVIICIASQWIGECIISLPFIYRNGSYCSYEIWMRFYTCMTAVVVPTMIIAVFNLLIYVRIRSSTRRVHSHDVETSINATQQLITSRRDISLLRQMFFTFFIFIVGWTPIYATSIISSLINIDPNISPAIAMISPICIISILINLFNYNHELRQYLINKIRLYLR